MAKPRGSSKKYGKHSPLLVSAKQLRGKLDTELAVFRAEKEALEQRYDDLCKKIRECDLQISQASGLTAAQIAILQRIRDNCDLRSYDFHQFQLNNLEYLQDLGYISGGWGSSGDPDEFYFRLTPEGAETLRVCEIEMQAE